MAGDSCTPPPLVAGDSCTPRPLPLWLGSGPHLYSNWMCVSLVTPHQVSFTHPLLLTTPPPVALRLSFDHLFPAEYNEVATSAAEANAASSGRASSMRRRGMLVRYSMASRRLQQPNLKNKALPEQGSLSVTLHPLSEQVGLAAGREKMKQLVGHMNNHQFALQLVLGACRYRVAGEELDCLPLALREMVQGYSSKEEEGRRLQRKSVDLLCWVACAQASVVEREGWGVVREAVGQLMRSLLHSCFIRGSRRVAHKCARLLVTLHRYSLLSLVFDHTHISTDL